MFLKGEYYSYSSISFYYKVQHPIIEENVYKNLTFPICKTMTCSQSKQFIAGLPNHKKMHRSANNDTEKKKKLSMGFMIRRLNILLA